MENREQNINSFAIQYDRIQCRHNSLISGDKNWILRQVISIEFQFIWHAEPMIPKLPLVIRAIN